MWKCSKKNKPAFILFFLVVEFSSIVLLPYISYAQEKFQIYSSISILDADDLAILSMQKGTYEEEIDISHLTVTGLTLGKSTLTDVRNKLGMAAYYKNKLDGDEADDELYFSSNIKGDDTVMVFSSGTYGGWEYIDGFSIITLGQIDTRQIKPAPSPLITKQISTRSGLRLGISPNELETIMGKKPSAIKGNTIFYFFHKARIGKDSDYDINSQVVAKFKNGKLTSLSVDLDDFYAH